ncbi:branched-chain amino acid transport system II carrier protein [Corallincola holothuriorum]|uniref:Branched-chain amino acid transport system carrier protein n=1 Tax=Corallincola holothuriorum TaxID=2282215 RepID=A0A368NQR8_9GAMM|nr:branched-chain amino acid transport system II carrier protein [Corallincola holothuriorum]RCU51829.1 branched-chain amino acid transport system II carrier protein [Corallincola holothuriorum]
MSETKQLSTTDIFALGFMTFAFFLGAGNIIFPPLAGQQAGTEFVPAMAGFLFTAVGLPLLTLLACAKAGGGLPRMTRLLPKGVGIAITLAIFIVIGPAFATPRTSLVAFEMGFKPFLSSAEPQAWVLLTYSIGFFIVAASLALHRGNLIDYIGKVLTPVLILLLLVLSVTVLMNPLGDAVAPVGDYVSQPFTKGFLEGYNTMDTFGALMFGMLIVDVLRKKEISDVKLQTRYLIFASIIAASGLAFVYMSLFYLGVTSNDVAPNAANGGEVFARYVQAMFGGPGKLILAAVVTLACLTTAVGLISACADYFNRLWQKVSYQGWVIIIAVLCAIVANVGLTQLIAVSVPVLFALYPVAIALVILNLLVDKLPNPKLAFYAVLSIALLMALLDAIKVTGLVEDEGLAFAQALPLFSYGLAWLLPVTVVLVGSFMMPKAAVTNS